MSAVVCVAQTTRLIHEDLTTERLKITIDRGVVILRQYTPVNAAVTE